MLDRSRSRDRSKTGGAFSPAGLFVSGAAGAWYDPSDFSTLYQTSTGTTPVTAVEQPVGLMLDRSRGLVLGAELVTNGDFASGTTGWTDISGAWAVTGGALVGTSVGASAYGPFANSTAVTAGRSYQATYTITITSGGLAARVGNTQSETYTASGTYTRFFVADTTGVTAFQVRASGSGFTGTIDNISVRELPGNHAVQATSASRPVLRARYNQLTYSEQFDNAAWTKTNATITANAAVAPDGTTTADKIITNNGASNGRPQQVATTANATAYTVSCYAKASEWGFIRFRIAEDLAQSVWFDLNTGAVGTRETGWSSASIQSVGNGWYRCSATHTTVGTSVTYRFIAESADNNSSTGDGVSGVLIWGAQLLTSADQSATGGAYQRIAAATDYDTTNPVWRPYLAFDGSDDSMSTSSVDFSGTDEVTLFAGVTKLSDAATQVFFELSANTFSNNGAFAAFIASGANEYVWRSRGTSSADVNIDNAIYLSPVTHVLTGIGDISGDVSQFRINGAQVGANTADQGAGNFGNYPLFIGRRDNTSFPFNGRLTSLIVLGRTATAAEISATEQWVAGKTGVNLP